MSAKTKRQIRVCVRCLRIIPPGDAATLLELGPIDSRRRWWLCGNVARCDEDNATLRADHRKEIDRRLAKLADGETLVVLFDPWGAEHGYGMRYCTTRLGEDPDVLGSRLVAEAEERDGVGFRYEVFTP